MKNNDDLRILVYLALINKDKNIVYVKTNTVKSKETLKHIKEGASDEFLKPLKIRAYSHDEAKIKACQFYGLNSDEFKIDKGRHHNLIEIEEIDF